MHRIDSLHAVEELPVFEAVGDIAGYFTEGTPSLGIEATEVKGDWLNAVQEELLAIIVAAGGTPTKGTNTQVRDAILSLLSAPSAGGLVQTMTTSAAVAAGVTKVFIDCTAGNVTATLPAASTGREIEFIRKDTTSNVATIQRAGSDLLLDQTSVELLGYGNKLKLLPTGTVWF